MEGMGRQGCVNSPPPYDPGHNPFAFYGGQCPQNVVLFSELTGDLTHNPPMFTWITPKCATTSTAARCRLETIGCARPSR